MNEPKQKNMPAFIIIGGLLLAIIVGVVFFTYKHTASNTPVQSDSSSSGPAAAPGSYPSSNSGTQQSCSQASSSACSGSQGGSHPPTIGTITAVSSSSVTIKDSSDSSSKTFSITSNTIELKDPNEPSVPYNVKDFHVGQTVGIGATNGTADVILPDYVVHNTTQ